MAAPKESWFKATMSRMGWGKEHLTEVDRSGFQYAETLTTAALVGSGVVGARARQTLYAKYQQMLFDPIVSGALRLHVTAALGGHETSGDLVFVEATGDARAKGADKESEAVAKELSEDLGPIFNRIAMQVAYNGVGWGDAYARLYAKNGKGVIDASVDEMLLPPLVQAYKQGNETKVCVIVCGVKQRERLTMNQMAHLEMPRMLYSPQPLAVEKAWRTKVVEDDIDALPLMPSLVGGSFLADAESQYDKFVAAMGGLVGQRVLDSIDESMFTAQCQGMTTEQTQLFLSNVRQMLEKSKKVADDAVKSGIPFLGRLRHLIPVWSDKQLLQVQGVNSSGGSGAGRAGNIAIEDVLFHAKLLCGALGIDITMLGFADMMSGGLGEGGFFRTSAQAAERSRTIRVALSDFFNHICDVHLAYKHGRAYEKSKRPWKINFYGTISALETERQRTETDAMNAGAIFVQTLTQMRDLGLGKDANEDILEKTMRMDTDRAKLYAKALDAAKAEAEAKAKAEADAQFGSGGFGAGGGGGGGEQVIEEPGGAQQDPAVAARVKH